MKDKIQEIDIQWISVNPDQPRRIFSLTELQELASSIEEIGLIHPPVVREIGLKSFELVAGERRFRALKLLGRKSISVLVKDVTRVSSSYLALIENIQRVDLNAIEVALSLKELMERFSLTQEQLAEKVGKKRSTVANFLRLLQLPKDVQTFIENGSLTMGHAKAVLSLPAAMQLNFSLKIIKEELSVRQAEKIVHDLFKDKESIDKKEDVHFKELKRVLEERFGTKVEISQSKITFDYYGWDDLDRLLEGLGISPCSI